jgi:hypothetical protein
VADTVAQLVEQVIAEGSFDASNAQALRWLTVRHRQMCYRARHFRRSLNLGPTVNEQASYPLPAEVTEILLVNVGGMVFGHMRHQDPPEGAKGWIWLGGEGGVAGREDTAEGETQLRLFPTPRVNTTIEPGLAIEAWCVCRPPDLIEGQDATLKIPGEFMDSLVAGAIATGMLRLENRPDLASGFEQVFDAACGELGQFTNKRFRGSGPAEIRVKGINA